MFIEPNHKPVKISKEGQRILFWQRVLFWGVITLLGALAAIFLIAVCVFSPAIVKWAIGIAIFIAGVMAIIYKS